MNTQQSVGGTYDQRFESLVALFAQQGPENPIGGSSLAVFKDGLPMVNVWQGEAAPGRPWEENTVSTVFSCTKGVISLLVARLVDQGLISLDEPVARYWPEFSQGGKVQISVSTLLQHRAGLSAVRRDLSRAELLDGHTVVDELAKQEPLWEPDSNYGYHALTFGHLVSKLIHSVTGLSANEYLQQHVATKLGINMWIGIPAENLGQVARLFGDGNFGSSNPEVNTNQYWVEKAMTLGGALPMDPTDAGGFNDPEVMAVELAGAGGITNAFGLAKIYSAAVTETDGMRLVSDSTIEHAIKPASFGLNVWNEPAPHPAWGNGFMLSTPPHVVMPGARGFGHNGLGGQAGWASLDERVGFGYTTSYLRNSPDTQKHQQDLVRELQKLLK